MGFAGEQHTVLLNALQLRERLVDAELGGSRA